MLRQARHERVRRQPDERGSLSLTLSKAAHAACCSLLLAACSGEESGSGAQSADTSNTPTGDAALSAGVTCATGGAQTFTSSCTVEQARVEGAPVLVIRHPDGGFRRLAVKNGTVAEADGAQQAVVTRDGDTIGVSIGSDRYRLDASVLGNGR